jgi:predicted RNase H-like HicB family nuclease
MVKHALSDLEVLLQREYPFQALADPDGGWVIRFPDLPGCFSQANKIEDVGWMADVARKAWITSMYKGGQDIPLPSMPEEFSGKFIVRVSRSLHRALAESARDEGVSLNQYVATLLGRRDSQAVLERRLQAIETQIGAINERLRIWVRGLPKVSQYDTTKEAIAA